MATWKEKYNKKYGFDKEKSHSLNAISKKTGVSKKGLQKIYNKGIGAWKSNIGSVRLKGSFKKNTNTKKYPRSSRIGKQQWAMARVYSAVMGGKASKVDAKELKMEMGGNIKDFQNNLISKYPQLKTLFLSENDKEIQLDMIEVEKNYRKSGVGSNVMNELIDYADKKNKVIVLVPAIRDDLHKTTSRNRLVKFYKRFGFVENKGRNKDFTKKGGSMYRLPYNKMEMGGMTDLTIKCYSCDWSWKQSEGGDDMYVCHKCGADNTLKYSNNFNKENFYKGYYERLTPSNMEVKSSGDGKVIIDLNKKQEFATGGVTTAIVTDPNEAMSDLQSTYGFKDVFQKGGGINYDYGSYTTFDKEEEINKFEGVQYILNGEYTLVARALYFKDKDLFEYYKYLQRLNISLEDCNKFALSLNKVFTEMVCDIKVNKLEGKKRSFAKCQIEQYNSITDQSSFYGMGIINSEMMTITTPIFMACCKEKFLERLSGKPIPALDVKNYYSFQTLIHELAHCLDFQYQFKQKKFPVIAHKEYFMDALYKIIDACKYGQLPLAKSFGVRAKSLKRISVLTKGKI